MGKCPSHYNLIEAARWLGVAPWELQRQPQAWMDWALNHKAATMAVKAGDF